MFCTRTPVLLPTPMHAPPSVAPACLGERPVAHGALIRCPPQERFCSVSQDTACFSFQGIVHGNGVNSAAQADFGSYSDNLISLFVVFGMLVPSGRAWTAYL